MSSPSTPPGSATPSPAGAKTWRYRPELDGLRTFAVLTIVFFHAQVAGAGSAFIVLDLFFVLSGFLVTNVVLQEVDVRGELRVGRYYARRVRRLLPAAVVTIAVTSVLFVLVASEPRRLEMIRQAQAALVYLANWQFIAEGADYFAGDIRDSPFMHFWSLSVEEQYYIFFPLLIVLWWRLAPHRGRVLLAMLGVGIVASLVSQVYWGVADPTRAYFATDARLFQLLAGAAAAVALREYATPADGGGVLWPRLGRRLALAGAVGYVIFGTELIAMSVSQRNILATFLAGALVLGVYTAPDSLLARFFALPSMTYLGKISYGIYLWHWPAVLVLDEVFEVRPLVIALMAIVVGIAMAAMSYELLETPIRRGRVLDGFPWQTVGVGLAVSIMAALFLVGPILSSSRAPALASGELVEETTREAARSARDDVRRRLRSPVPQDLDFEQIRQDRGEPGRQCGPDDPDRCVVVDGDGPHVVLVGDSHARMLGDALTRLAEEKDIKLSSSVVPACPWQDGVLNRRTNPRNSELCRETRRDFYRETLPRMEADVVVLMGFPRSGEGWDRAVTDIDNNRQDLHPFLQDATDRTVRLVRRAGASSILVKSVMGTGGWDVEGPDPLDCLARARNQGECLVSPPPDRPLVDSFYDAAAVGDDTVATVDLTPIICPDHPACQPIVDGEVVWRNSDHVTARFFVSQREAVWQAIEETRLLPG